MADFINTIDALGDDAVIDSIIDRTITEFKDDKLTMIGRYAFNSCKTLSSVDIPNAIEILDWAFCGCESLAKVEFPKLKSVLIGSFQNCVSITIADFPAAESFNSQAFLGSNVKAVLLRNTQKIATLDSSNVFGISGYWYVPSSLIGGYKTATNWSALADKIRALEDYTVDGTITGELDESKI